MVFEIENIFFNFDERYCHTIERITAKNDNIKITEAEGIMQPLGHVKLTV